MFDGRCYRQASGDVEGNSRVHAVWLDEYGPVLYISQQTRGTLPDSSNKPFFNSIRQLMRNSSSQERLREMVSQLLPPHQVPQQRMPLAVQRSLYPQFVLEQAGAIETLIESIPWSCPGAEFTTSLPYPCNEPRICVLWERPPHRPAVIIASIKTLNRYIQIKAPRL